MPVRPSHTIHKWRMSRRRLSKKGGPCPTAMACDGLKVSRGGSILHCISHFLSSRWPPAHAAPSCNATIPRASTCRTPNIRNVTSHTSTWKQRVGKNVADKFWARRGSWLEKVATEDPKTPGPAEMVVHRRFLPSKLEGLTRGRASRPITTGEATSMHRWSAAVHLDYL